MRFKVAGFFHLISIFFYGLFRLNRLLLLMILGRYKYGISSSNIASTSTTVFVPPSNMLKLRTMMLKLIQLVRTQTKVNLSQEHPLSKIRKRLKPLKLRRLALKSLNKRSSIFVIIVELLVILDQIAIIGQPLNRATTDRKSVVQGKSVR